MARNIKKKKTPAPKLAKKKKKSLGRLEKWRKEAMSNNRKIRRCRGVLYTTLTKKKQGRERGNVKQKEGRPEGFVAFPTNPTEKNHPKEQEDA